MRNKTIRFFYLVLGHGSLFIGVIAIVVPFVPTVPFLILAAFCYERGSPRMHERLLANPYVGPHLLRWNQTGSIAPRVKILAISLLALSIGMATYKNPYLWADVILIVIAGGASLYIATRPAR